MMLMSIKLVFLKQSLRIMNSIFMLIVDLLIKYCLYLKTLFERKVLSSIHHS